MIVSAQQQELRNCFLTAIFTSWMSPCSTWLNTNSNDANIKSRQSQKPSSNKFMTFLGIGSMSAISICIFACYVIITFSSDDRKFPIFHCFNVSSSANRTQCSLSTNISHFSEFNLTSCFQFCEDSACLQVERICEEGEHPTDLFFQVVGPSLLALLLFSFFATLILQYLSNYHNVYRISGHIFTPIIHPSIFIDLLDDNNSIHFDKLEHLANTASQQTINYADSRTGDTW